ncbi:hypothetical protein ACZ90_50465 [Streptomyces albus subsp. albus]|nr:hypothetical protein ACZ90_50465 [Streptomyces albus subsp. albus]
MPRAEKQPVNGAGGADRDVRTEGAGMSPSGGVTRNTLRRQIADALRDEVVAGRLPPGRMATSTC